MCMSANGYAHVCFRACATHITYRDGRRRDSSPMRHPSVPPRLLSLSAQAQPENDAPHRGRNANGGERVGAQMRLSGYADGLRVPPDAQDIDAGWQGRHLQLRRAVA